MLRIPLFFASLLAAVGMTPVYGQVVAPSTWATGIVIEPFGTPPSSELFDDWDSIPLALTDPEDNPSVLNILDIKDVKVANDANLFYIYASGHKMRTRDLYLAFDTDQNVATGFNIFGLDLVGSELGYVNDFVFDQRTPGVFNNNQPDPGGNCCTGGPSDPNNGGALLNPAWDVEFEEREWGIPLDAVWSAVEPFGPTFPNPTFNFIVWTDQGLSDVTEVITYTLAAPPAGTAGDYNDDGKVDAADYVVYRKNEGTMNMLPNDPHGGMIGDNQYNTWRANFGVTEGGGSGLSNAVVPEPATAALLILAAFAFVASRRRS